MTIKASGVANGTDKLFVYVNTLGYPCEAEPRPSYGNYLTASEGEALPAGSYTKEYPYTPTGESMQRHYSICGYLDKEAFSFPNAKAEYQLEVHPPAASLAFEVHPNPTIQNQAVEITVSGSTQLPRNLYVYSNDSGASCGINPGNESGAAAVVNGQALSPGAYVEHYVYTPTSASTFDTLCGYVAREAWGLPDATGTANFTVISLASIAEAQQRAAEKRAEEERAAKRKYEEEAPAREAAARVKAEQDAEARANQTPVTYLAVKTIAHVGKSSQHPGYTEIVISTSNFANITLKLRRYGRRTEEFVAFNPTLAATAQVQERIEWTCRRPGSSYSYVVASRSKVGPALVQRGRFTPVSVARCRALKRAETEAKQRSARRYAEEVRRQERQERERLERYEANCRTLGGTPVTLYTSEGAERVCRAPGGGRIRVPS